MAEALVEAPPSTSVTTYTIIQADGLYPDDTVEQEIFAPHPGQNYKLTYLQTHLFPPGSPTAKPWLDIPKSIRDQVDGIMVLKMGFTAEDADLFPRLKVIVRMGVGYDRLDRVALDKRKVTVCNVPGEQSSISSPLLTFPSRPTSQCSTLQLKLMRYVQLSDYGTAEIADHALGLALSLRRGILLHHDRQRAPYVLPWAYIDTPLVSRLQGFTFGILGLGRIGTAACLRAKAFGWNVIFYDPYVPNGTDKALGIERTKDIRELFRRSATLSIHCSCTRETRDMVGWDLISLMPQGSVLVNTGRGEVLQLDAVERGLREGILAGAGLDVLPEEPIPEDNVHSLIKAYRDKEEWLVGRMALTCHTAFFSPQSFVDIRVKSCETIRDVLIDGGSSNIITPDMM